jgi:hypothetical protein
MPIGIHPIISFPLPSYIKPQMSKVGVEKIETAITGKIGPNQKERINEKEES